MIPKVDADCEQDNAQSRARAGWRLEEKSSRSSLPKQTPVRSARGSLALLCRRLRDLVVDPPVGLLHAVLEPDRWLPVKQALDQNVVRVATAHAFRRSEVVAPA